MTDAAVLLVLATLTSLNAAVIIWLCFQRDRLVRRINMIYKILGEMK